MRSFNPGDWYWLAEDGRLFSSARRAVIDTADDGYLAWLDGGLGPTPWPRDAAGEQSVAALKQVLVAFGLAYDLADLKMQLCAAVDTAAESERRRYVTAGAGQAMEYQQAAAEAERLIAALAADPELEPGAAEYPMLSASLGLDGATLAEVAATVSAMHAQWCATGAAIRAVRLAGKAAIMAAADEAGVRAAADVVWPEVPA